MLDDLRALVSSAEGRRLIAERLEHSIRRSQMGRTLLDRVHLMHDYLRDPAEPIGPKLLIGAALLYLVIPSDLIPDWIALIGFADDFAAISYVWHQTRDVLHNYDMRRQQRLLAG